MNDDVLHGSVHTRCSLAACGTWSFECPRDVDCSGLLETLSHTGLYLQRGVHDTFITELDRIRPKRRSKWTLLESKRRFRGPVVYSQVGATEVLGAWEAAGTGNGRHSDRSHVLVTVGEWNVAGSGEDGAIGKIWYLHAERGVDLMKLITSTFRFLQRNAVTWREIPSELLHALRVTNGCDIECFEEYLEQVFPRCGNIANDPDGFKWYTSITGTPIVSRMQIHSPDASGHGTPVHSTMELEGFDDTSSTDSLAPSSFGESWRGTIPSFVALSSSTPSILLRNRCRVVPSPDTGRLMYLGSRPTSPAGAIAFVPVSCVVASAFSSAWPMEDATGVLRRSAALFSLISTMQHSATYRSLRTVPSCDLYRKARALLASGRYGTTCMDDADVESSMLRHACTTLYWYHEMQRRSSSDWPMEPLPQPLYTQTYETAMHLYSSIHTLLDSHRLPQWRACNYTLTLASFSGARQPTSFKGAPEWGHWIKVTFLSAASATPTRLMATVVAINSLAGTAVACCDPTDGATGIYIQEPWIQAVRIAAVMEAVSRRHRTAFRAVNTTNVHPYIDSIRYDIDTFVSVGGGAFSAVTVPPPCSSSLALMASRSIKKMVSLYETPDACLMPNFRERHRYRPESLEAHAVSEWISSVLDVLARQSMFDGSEQWIAARDARDRGHGVRHMNGEHVCREDPAVPRMVACVRALNAFMPRHSDVVAHLLVPDSSAWQLLCFMALPYKDRVGFGLYRCGIEALNEFLFRTKTGMVYVRFMTNDPSIPTVSRDGLRALCTFAVKSKGKLFADSHDALVISGLIDLACWTGVPKRIMAAIFGFFVCVVNKTQLELPREGGGYSEGISSILSGETHTEHTLIDSVTQTTKTVLSTLVRMCQGYEEAQCVRVSHRCTPSMYSSEPMDVDHVFPLWPSPLASESATNMNLVSMWRNMQPSTAPKKRKTSHSLSGDSLKLQHMWPKHVPLHGDTRTPFSGAPSGFLDSVVGQPIVIVTPPS